MELRRQQENKESTIQAEDSQGESDHSLDNEEHLVPEVEPASVANISVTAISSRSVHSIGEQLAAVEIKNPESRAPTVAIEMHSKTKTGKGIRNTPEAEEVPDVRTISTAGSFTRLKEVAEKFYPETTEG